MKLITKDTHYLKLQNKLIKKIKSSYYDSKYLYDGLNDKTIKSNIFLSYYFEKKILTPNEWRTVFNNSLKKLWLKWGGISSLDKESHNFISSHTGENPLSYHNGDSWFFVNNLAALSLFDLDRKMFKTNIEKIINSSTESCLKFGCLGCMPELSSALSLKSEGCPLQTWSLSTYIELINKTVLKK
jgi:glycogen debranching enzyme